MECRDCPKLRRCSAVEAIVVRREKFGEHPKACEGTVVLESKYDLAVRALHNSERENRELQDKVETYEMQVERLEASSHDTIKCLENELSFKTMQVENLLRGNGELQRKLHEGRNNTQKLVSALRGASDRLLRDALDCLPSHELAEIARAVHGRIYKRLEG